MNIWVPYCSMFRCTELVVPMWLAPYQCGILTMIGTGHFELTKRELVDTPNRIYKSNHTLARESHYWSQSSKASSVFVTQTVSCSLMYRIQETVCLMAFNSSTYWVPEPSTKHFMMTDRYWRWLDLFQHSRLQQVLWWSILHLQNDPLEW